MNSAKLLLKTSTEPNAVDVPHGFVKPKTVPVAAAVVVEAAVIAVAVVAAVAAAIVMVAAAVVDIVTVMAAVAVVIAEVADIVTVMAAVVNAEAAVVATMAGNAIAAFDSNSFERVPPKGLLSHFSFPPDRGTLAKQERPPISLQNPIFSRTIYYVFQHSL